MAEPHVLTSPESAVSSISNASAVSSVKTPPTSRSEGLALESPSKVSQMATPTAVPSMAPPQRLSASTEFKAANIWATAEFAEDEEWEDVPATAIRDMDQMTAQHKLFKANALIRRLRSALARSRVKSSQYHLQTRLLKIETEESLRRHQVENAIVKREVDRLRMDLIAIKQDTGFDHMAEKETERYRLRLVRAKGRLFETQKKLEERDLVIDKLKHKAKRHGSGHEEDGGLAALGILASQVLSQQRQQHDGPPVQVQPRLAGLKEKKVDLVESLNTGSDTDVVDSDEETTEHISRLVVKHDKAFDPDETIDIISSPAVVGTFSSINNHSPGPKRKRSLD
ncbi:hypothetical protein V1512DRAFT_258158 [Lipomyces arxii]|uniref:uncharacterized protein n=1 Tax=Lipomyces arxii TaxID=56418 RepID=UPI0034CD9DDA